ncbi:PfkB family carbohydrate kinase [Nocardioides sp. Bht2]|uniref:PfkB family carbohydrate kinase n=1 Tax=Nocardioides sp. Bht2 TaxID=3392297 RepID=UPI0039B6D5B6
MEYALVVGESVLDVVHGVGVETLSHPGGSAVNTAVALARLGRTVRLATCFADDDGGRLIAAHLAAAGVEPVGDPHVVAATARAEATIDSSGAAHYEITVDWQLPALGLERPRILHITSFAPLLAPGADQVVALVERLRDNCMVSYDVNLRPAVTGTGPHLMAAVQRMASQAHLVKASDEDLAVLWPALTPSEGAGQLLAFGAQAVVVTRGAAGASWHARRRDGMASGGVRCVPVEVADTIGAGDTFAAALLDRLWPLVGEPGADLLAELAADQWSDALNYAARAAAVTVSRPGADPPHAAELHAQ